MTAVGSGDTPGSRSILFIKISWPAQARGVRDILAVDLSSHMLETLQQQFPPPSTLGNDPGVSKGRQRRQLAGRS